MKLLLSLLAAGLLTTSGLRAQTSPATVLPSGAVALPGEVAPNGRIITPGTVPGSQPLTTPDMRDGGSPRARRRDQKIPGLRAADRKELRKLRKVRALPTEDGKIKKQ